MNEQHHYLSESVRENGYSITKLQAVDSAGEARPRSKSGGLPVTCALWSCSPVERDEAMTGIWS